MADKPLTESELAIMREGLKLAARNMRVKGAAKVAEARVKRTERLASRNELDDLIFQMVPDRMPFRPDWQREE